MHPVARIDLSDGTPEIEGLIVSMPIQREFLNWRQPALFAAVDYLFQRYRDSTALIDLSQALVVLPSSRAARRLTEVLVAEAERREISLFPPQITTMGTLPEFLYERKLPFANPLVQQLAWAEALRGSDRRRLAEFVTDVPRHDTDPRWLELAALLQIQHRELAADGLRFEDVWRKGENPNRIQ